MLMLFILVAAITYSVVLFRSTVRAEDLEGRRAERRRDPDRPRKRRAWRVPVLATLGAWLAVTGAVAPIDQVAAVWAGGVVVAVGVAWVLRSIPDPTRIDDESFDRELRELLDRHGRR